MALEYHLTDYDKMSNRSHVPPPVDWHGMLRGIQGIRTLVEVQTGNLQHIGESSKSKYRLLQSISKNLYGV